jgi:DNA-binding HxlR family transcriptional regulator
MSAREKKNAAEAPAKSAGRFAYDGLERTLHEKARLGIVTSLMARPEGLLFGELKELCTLTDGNLNRHLKVLEDDQVVEVWKGYRHKRPQTLVRITPAGRQRFLDYVSVLERVVSDAARVAAMPQPATGAASARWERQLGWASG